MNKHIRSIQPVDLVHILNCLLSKLSQEIDSIARDQSDFIDAQDNPVLFSIASLVSQIVRLSDV